MYILNIFCILFVFIVKRMKIIIMTRSMTIMISKKNLDKTKMETKQLKVCPKFPQFLYSSF